MKHDSSEEDIGAVSGDRIVCTLRKCIYCRHYVTAANMARHVKNKHPHRIINRSHHKDKYKSVREAKSVGVTYVCPPPCGKIFDRKDNLDRHKKRKTCYWNATHKCKLCFKIFTSEDAGFNHLEFRKCKKQFGCKSCDMGFRLKIELWEHQKICNINID